MPDWQAFEEAQLVREAQCGSPEAFGELYKRNGGAIFRFLYAHLSDRLDAEDLTEEVFLRAWRSLGRYKETGAPFGAFLYRIAQNVMVDFHRSLGRSGVAVEVEISDLYAPHPGPAGEVADRLEHQELRQTLGQLRQDYQMVLVARFLSELSPEETAELMGKSIGAVRVLQHRALAALRKLMNGYPGIEHDPKSS